MRGRPIQAAQSDEQETVPLRRVEHKPHPANVSVQAYFSFYHLSWREAGQAAGLVLVSVWRVVHNLPVSQVHAAALRAGLHRLTGIAYLGPIPTSPPEDHAHTGTSSAWSHQTGWR